MVEVVALDMWQTLGTYSFNLYEEVLKVSGLKMSIEEFVLEKGKVEVDNKLSDKERFIEKIKLMGITDRVTLQRIKELYVKAHNSIFLYEDTIKTLKELKKSGKVLVLITNVDHYAHSRIMKLFPKNLFDSIFASYRVGIRKPDKRIFMKLTEEYPKKPEEIMMVGDSETMDIKPAKQLGWKTAFINEAGKKSRYADYNLRSLKELVETVKRI